MNDQAHRTKVPVYANKIMSASIPYYEIPEDSMAPRLVIVNLVKRHILKYIY
jgi:hypothetical protein